jgi:hypothetical protein
MKANGVARECAAPFSFERKHPIKRSEEETPIMIADLHDDQLYRLIELYEGGGRKLDQEMLAALTRLGFEINPGGGSAYAEVSVFIGDDMDFRLQIVTDNGARVVFRRVAREQILSFAKAVDLEGDAIVGLANRAAV